MKKAKKNKDSLNRIEAKLQISKSQLAKLKAGLAITADVDGV